MTFRVVPALGLTNDVEDSLFDGDRHGHGRNMGDSYCERSFFTIEPIPEPVVEIPDLEDYKLSSFLHAEAHDLAGTDFEECVDDGCPHWPAHV